MIDAALGNKESALVEGRKAVELLPVTKDAIVGPLLLQNLATIYAWTGEKTPLSMSWKGSWPCHPILVMDSCVFTRTGMD